MEIFCIGCGKIPEQLQEYIEMALCESTPDKPLTPTQYVQQEEGTYNRENGHFACTSCYIKMGQPSRPFPDRWVAP